MHVAVGYHRRGYHLAIISLFFATYINYFKQKEWGTDWGHILWITLVFMTPLGSELKALQSVQPPGVCTDRSSVAAFWRCARRLSNLLLFKQEQATNSVYQILRLL